MRATIRRGSLTLVPAEFASVRGGPAGCLARAALGRSVSIADLEFGDEAEDEDDEDHDEASAEEKAADEEAEDGVVRARFIVNDTPVARRALRRWAALTGHRRIWFRDEVVELEPPPGLDREFGTRCPSCGLDIVDSGPALIEFVHDTGHFPISCFTCGGFVPQWAPVGRESRDRVSSARRHARARESFLRVADG